MFADLKFKCDENGRMLPKKLENTEGKGEIARYEQFLVMSNIYFSHSVSRLVLQSCKNQGVFGKGLKMLSLEWKTAKYRTAQLDVLVGPGLLQN